MNVPIHRRFDAGMTEQFLQHFWLHPAFGCTRCIGAAQSVHTESPDSRLIAQQLLPIRKLLSHYEKKPLRIL